MKNLLVIIVVTTLGLAGCTTYDPYTGEQEVSKTAIGGGVGAGVGAVVAYLENKDEDSDEKRRRILEGAAVGGALGSGVGYYMDRQEAKLRKELRGTGVSVQREGDNLNLVMPGNITFATDSPAINSQFYPVLDSVTKVIKEFDKTRVVIAGHTDSTGAASYNQQLSKERANAVAAYLRSNDVLSARLDTIGFGESQPIASNDSAAGREQNRRAEITLLPVT